MVLCLLGLYCFTWLRIPDEIASINAPVQRLIAASMFPFMIGAWWHVPVQPHLRGFLFTMMLLLFVIIISGINAAAHFSFFSLSMFVMEVFKLVAGVMATMAVYYGLVSGMMTMPLVTRVLTVSMVLCLGVTLAGLLLFWLQIPVSLPFLAPRNLGIFDIGSTFPRLAGTTAEPQQFSYILGLPVLLLIAKVQKTTADKFLIGFALAILLASQSKFAIVTVGLAIGFFLFCEWRGFGFHKRLLVVTALCAGGAGAAALAMQSAVYMDIIHSGAEAGAIAERLWNIMQLVQVIQREPWLGIGFGQYSTYISHLLYGDPMATLYRANMDYLSLVAETGAFGLLLFLSFLGTVYAATLRACRHVPRQQQRMMVAVLVSLTTILLNMMIGYAMMHIMLWIHFGLILYLLDSNSRPRHSLQPILPGVTLNA